MPDATFITEFVTALAQIVVAYAAIRVRPRLEALLERIEQLLAVREGPPKEK